MSMLLETIGTNLAPRRVETQAANPKDQSTADKTVTSALATEPFTLPDGNLVPSSPLLKQLLGNRLLDSSLTNNMLERKWDAMPSETSSEPRLTSLINNASVKKNHQRKFSSAEMKVRAAHAKVSISTLERPPKMDKNLLSIRFTKLETSRCWDLNMDPAVTPTLMTKTIPSSQEFKSNASAIARYFITSTTIEERELRESTDKRLLLPKF